MIGGITHVTRYSLDLGRALAFWQGVLGFQVVMDREFAAGQRWLTLRAPGQAGVELVLLDPRGWLQGEALQAALASVAHQPQLILSTGDIDGALVRLRGAGVPLDTPQVRDLPWGRDLVLRDPSGSSVNLVQSHPEPVARRAQLVLNVRSVRASVDFYVGKLGWALVHDGGSVVVLGAPDGDAAVLTEDPSADLSGWLDVAWDAPVPGKRVYLGTPDAHAWREELAARGVTGVTLEEEGYGRVVSFPDPDGFVLAYWQELPVSDEEVLAVYRAGPDELEAALAGLTDAQLDLVRAPGKWSIRQIVLHLIDSDVTSSNRAKFSLAEPGREYVGNPYSPDVWAQGTDYAGRPIEVELRLFRALREHLLGLVEHLPGALDRTVRTQRGEPSVRGYLKVMGGHARGHVGQILETRRAHGLGAPEATGA